MRCHICDTLLEPEEVKQHPVTYKFEPCPKCLTISKKALNDFQVNEDTWVGEEGNLSSEDIDTLLI